MGMQIIPNKLYLAMNAALFIAYNGSENQPVSGSAIVEYCDLNKRALEPVLQKLSKADIIVSVKGAKGGYFMPNPEDVSLKDIVEAFIEDVIPKKHDFSGYTDILNDTLFHCHQDWIASLSAITFKRLCQDARSTGALNPINKPVLNFTI